MYKKFNMFKLTLYLIDKKKLNQNNLVSIYKPLELLMINSI